MSRYPTAVVYLHSAWPGAEGVDNRLLSYPVLGGWDELRGQHTEIVLVDDLSMLVNRQDLTWHVSPDAPGPQLVSHVSVWNMDGGFVTAGQLADVVPVEPGGDCCIPAGELTIVWGES